MRISDWSSDVCSSDQCASPPSRASASRSATSSAHRSRGANSGGWFSTVCVWKSYMAWAPCETFRFSRKERCGCVPRRACRNRRRGKAFSLRRECAHPRSSLRCVSKAQSKGAWLFPKPAIRSPAWPAGLRGEIKEEAAAVRRMPGDIRPEGLRGRSEERGGGKEGDRKCGAGCPRDL